MTAVMCIGRSTAGKARPEADCIVDNQRGNIH